MPRIDPLQLLKCLSVLLGPHGGIKSPEDVARLVSLMSKFSKKLVSKCIYVQILQATTTSLLSQFMRQGGWDLVSTWIIEAAAQGNGPLLEQLLALTLQCPLDVQQLQINNCPRSVKSLTRDAPTQRVQELAVVLVDSWVQMARQQTMPMQQQQQQQQTYTPVMPTIMPVPMQQQQQQQLLPQVQEPPSTVNHEYLQQQPDLPQHFVQPTMVQEMVPQLQEPEPMHVEVQHQIVNHVVKEEQVTEEEPVHHMIPQEVEMQEIPAEEIKMEEPAHEEEVEEEETGGSNGSAEENDQWDAPLGQLPVYKITIRDGKQVLAKVYSGEQRAQKPPSSNTVVIKIAKEQPRSEAEPVVVKQEDGAVPLKQEITPKVPRGPGRRKQLLKPIASEQHETARMDVPQEGEKKKGPIDKITARMAKEQAARRAERIQREKHQKLKEKLLEREAKEKERKAKVQEEKDQETLARLLGANKVASVGKIPKKVKVEDDKDRKPEERKSELRRNSAEEERRREKSKSDNKVEVKKEKEETKKGVPSIKSEHPTIKTEHKKDLHKNAKSSSPASSISSSINHSKIKVKSFNAKPRTTGLEEPIGPPPARGQSKKDKDKKPNLSLSISKKRVSPPPGKELLPPEKKQKPNTEDEAEAAKPAAIPSPKLKPKQNVHVIQESGFFMDALNAMPRPEPRKRKRRTSSSKDDASTSKSSDSPAGGHESPSQSPKENSKRRSTSPTTVARPNFYKDTLETSIKSDKEEEEAEERSPQIRTPTPTGDGGEAEEEATRESDEGVTKGVLVLHRSINRVKKTVKFRDEESLCTVVYFELDETERVNVTRTFGDMKILELERERELMQTKKMAISDMQEERIPWRPLIPVDCPAPLVEPGKNSREKDVQLAREKSTLAALYFSTSLIPDNPAEPDPENHPTTDPTPIPLDDKTGNPDSVKDYSHLPWPEPKVGPPPTPAFVPNVATFNPGVAPAPVPPGGGWRTGDGQVLSSGPGDVYANPNNFMPPHTGYETGNPGAYGYGYETPGGFVEGANFAGGPPDMNNGPMGHNNFIFPPPGPGNFRPQGPGNWGPPMGVPPPMGGPPMGGHPPMGGPGGPGPMGHGPMGPNDMRGGPPRFPPRGSRGGNRGGWQGPPRGGGGPRGKGWNGGGGSGRGSVCKHFRSGYCRNGESCNFLHPGVNSPNF